MAVKMMAAYYSSGCDSYELFQYLNIAQEPEFRQELNRYPVIYLDIQWFYSVVRDKGIPEQVVSYMQREVLKELYQRYPDIVAEEDNSLSEALLRIHSRVGEQFIFLIDEWDAVLTVLANGQAVLFRQFLNYCILACVDFRVFVIKRLLELNIDS